MDSRLHGNDSNSKQKMTEEERMKLNNHFPRKVGAFFGSLPFRTLW